MPTSDFLDRIEQIVFDRGYSAVCGVDEVGRGPLAGPVVAAAVILPAGVVIDGVDDSKKLSSHRREQVFDEIARLGIPCAVGIIDHETIDRVNILKASLLAMRKAVMDLKQAPDIVLVDGNAGIPNISQPQFSIVGGDRRCKSIAAASIVAKVTRDRIMDNYEALYPSFSFAKHKGYPTPAHLRELREHGPCEIHRRTFRPVADLVQQYALFR
ncbi:MAG: ribonuclease HII [Candidatus Zixiibacteriota bacterium]|nr:MAG: ribonuclease HII [candidate division Zixibacteria bacterium]